MKIAEFITKNQTLILYAGGAILTFYVLNKIKNSLSTTLPEKINTLGQGLKNPLDAIGTFATGGVFLPKTGGADLTENLNWYIKYYYGTVENYLSVKKSGKKDLNPPYNKSTDYKTLYVKRLKPIFSL